MRVVEVFFAGSLDIHSLSAFNLNKIQSKTFTTYLLGSLLLKCTCSSTTLRFADFPSRTPTATMTVKDLEHLQSYVVENWTEMSMTQF